MSSAASRVSVVVPTHNRAHLVPDAIRSCLALRACGIDPEIIVVDDGSSDGTPEVLRAFRDDIVAVHCAHGERSKARNTGLSHATAPIVGFLDDDDLCVAEGWGRLVEAMDTDPQVHLAYGRAVFTDAAGKELPYRSHPDSLEPARLFFSLLTLGCHISMGTAIVRREALGATGGFDEALCAWEDWDLWLRLAFSGKATYVDEPCAVIRSPDWDDRPETHKWPQKLRVRARYSLPDPYCTHLRYAAQPAELATFWEQLACDAFTYRLHAICWGAFRRLFAIAPRKVMRPRRLAQLAISRAAVSLRMRERKVRG